jgi:hypothetical protein
LRLSNLARGSFSLKSSNKCPMLTKASRFSVYHFPMNYKIGIMSKVHAWPYDDADEGNKEYPTITEKDFEALVSKQFEKPIFLGKNRKGEDLYLDFDFSVSVFDEERHRWLVASVYFGVMDSRGGYPVFTLLKNPGLKVYKENRFEHSMVEWMTKKFKLVGWNDLEVSREIMKRISAAQNY